MRDTGVMFLPVALFLLVGLVVLAFWFGQAHDCTVHHGVLVRSFSGWPVCIEQGEH